VIVAVIEVHEKLYKRRILLQKRALFLKPEHQERKDPSNYRPNNV
jgi:hypothetical protein